MNKGCNEHDLPSGASAFSPKNHNSTWEPPIALSSWHADQSCPRIYVCDRLIHGVQNYWYAYAERAFLCVHL